MGFYEHFAMAIGGGCIYGEDALCLASLMHPTASLWHEYELDHIDYIFMMQWGVRTSRSKIEFSTHRN